VRSAHWSQRELGGRVSCNQVQNFCIGRLCSGLNAGQVD
jgi:hypothetical protein